MAPSDAKPLPALVVDDEADIRELLELTLARMGLESRSAATLAEARALLSQQQFSLCLTDMRLPDGNGIDFVRHIQQQAPQMPTAMITAHGSMASAIEALKAGAFDFVTKPVELQALRELVNTALRLSPEVPPPASGPDGGLTLLGESETVRGIRGTIAKLARSQAPVYISGESGTGKELAARLIHQQGPRADAPFIPVNCGAIPAELMESELFGHKRGSFTGANTDKEGLFQAANGGTLFLDEVADLPLQMQVKLLRAIQEKAVRPIGAAKEVHVDVRILSATHQDLSNLVQEGRFREDLYYRINVIELHIPPLRERVEDIPPLVDHILRRLAVQMGVREPHLTPKALEALLHYAFPGNVRELENILERALTLCEGENVTEEDLQLPTSATQTPSSRKGSGLEPLLQDMERQTILDALERARYNKTRAAELLGLTFRQLRYRLKKLGID